MTFYLKDHNWLEFERTHVWHPYAPLEGAIPPVPVESAQGVYLKLHDGRTLIDGMSSWWSAIHGYNHPLINRAARDQLDRMSHVMFGGLTHRPAAELAARLVALTPDPLEKVFFCDSGSVSVEVAIKLAIQYWSAKGAPKKQKMLTIRHGYHGDTTGAMAVCDPETGMHQLFNQVLVQHFFADAPAARYDQPWQECEIASFHENLEAHHSEIAAVIMEPIVQGAGGMRFYSPEFLRRARVLCDNYNVLLITDEIATGFGRTGKMFACEHAGISPDIMCVGKALTGGYLTLAAVLTSAEISHAISTTPPGAFMHGPTFMANPLACAIANASIDLLVDSPWQERISCMENAFKEHLHAFRNRPGVSDVRWLGGIAVIELERPVNMASITQRFIDQGIWLRPFGKLVYTMPPFIISDQELESLVGSLCMVVGQELMTD